MDSSDEALPEPPKKRPVKTDWGACSDWIWEWSKDNPKRPKTKAHDRWEKYCKAPTVAEALSCGASLRDLDSDFKHKYLAIREPQLALPAPSDMESEDLAA